MENMPTQELEELRYISYESQDAIGYITLNRPDKRNALSYDVVAELKQAFEVAEDDEHCKVIVLRAVGDVFCAGTDLASIQEQALQGVGYPDHLSDSAHLMQLFHQIYTLKKIVIGQVQGHALAGGCGLATICDFAFTVPDAQFGYTEVKLGLLPAIVSVFLVRKIGEARTKQLLLTGDVISAQLAADFGLVNFLVPKEELADNVYRFARRLCVENSGQSMEITKEMLARLPDMALEDSLRYAAQLNAEARSSNDCRRGVEAFLNKEKIAWD
ncbi:enoyl-CoA hydratase/isomerase family protein [Hymenobacter crusticola]|nr:enoyl-CoA hydratase/isomerase family protein [Hymenobacter crusticola]